MIASPRRLPSIDGLRAVSILIVLVNHVSVTRNFPEALLPWVPDGGLGVRIFFVISGFLITYLLLTEEEHGRISLPRFYYRRALRILPVFWSFLLVIGILGRLGALTLAQQDLIQPLTFTNSFWFWKYPLDWVTSHSWSLAMEEQFYLLWPLTMVLFPRRGRTAIVMLVLLAAPLLRVWIRLHPRQSWMFYYLPAEADMIGWGCLLAMAYQHHRPLLSRMTNWRPMIGRILAMLAIVFAPAYCTKVFGAVSIGPSMTIHAVAISYLIASFILERKGISYWLLNQPVSIAVGLISYSLYIWQQPFLFPAQIPHRIFFCQNFPINLPTVFVVATLSYFCIEMPMRRLGKQLIFKSAALPERTST